MLTPFPDEMRGYRYGSGCQWSHFEVRQERGEPLPSVIVNEAYPDPDMDIDGNGIADQEDEFVELRNLYPGPLSLDGMSLTDGTSTFILDGIIMDGDSILMLNRSQTGLKLGRDDSVTLLNGSGGVLDSFSYSGAFKGVSYQRSSTDIERWMTTKVPTPGTVNLPSPQMLINEVMVDPEGANGGKQWVELLNHGHGWNLQGFTLGNHEGVRVELPSVHVNAGGRVLIHLGPPRTCCPHPPDIPVVFSDQSDPLYTSGDDLELLDRDGYSMDYLAWGNSSHVDRATGKGDGGSWDGRTFDHANGSMVGSGGDNPVPVTGRSLSRCPDGGDTDSPADWSYGPLLSGGTPGFNNSLDPDIQIITGPERIPMNESESRTLRIGLEPGTNMSGNMILLVEPLNGSWSASPEMFNISVGNGSAPFTESVTIRAPGDLGISHTCDFRIRAFWDDLPFLEFESSFNAYIPSFNAELIVDGPFLDGFESSRFPEGSFIELKGQVKCSGEISGGSTMLHAALYNAVEGPAGLPVEEQWLELEDLKPTSRRSFSFMLDTLDLEGNLSLEVSLDPGDLIKEYNSSDNDWKRMVEILPTHPGEGVSSLLITEVLWNETRDGCFARIMNPTSLEVDLSGIRLGMGDDSIEFPDGASLSPDGSALVVWGEEGAEHASPEEPVFRVDNAGPVSMRMKNTAGSLDLSRGDDLFLSTRFRDGIDSVTLKRCMLPPHVPEDERASFPEATHGTVIRRRTNGEGTPLDTDSNLDWAVEADTAVISRVLVDPGPSGPGEFVSIRSPGTSGDLRGFGLVRGAGMVVIPWSIEGGKNEITISMDPGAYRDREGADPDLSVIDDDRVRSCRVEGMAPINLPNNGGELVLVDRGNREVDRLSWGREHDLGPLPKGVVLGRVMSLNDLGGWKAVGDAALPLVLVMSDEGDAGNCTLSFKDPLMLDELTGNVRRKATIVLPALTSERIAASIMDIREKGYQVDLFIHEPPWGRDISYQVATPNEHETGWMRELTDSGIDVLCSEHGFGYWGCGFILTDHSIGTFAVPRGEIFEDEHRTTGVVLSSESGEPVPGMSMIGTFLLNADWYDPSHLLDSVRPVVPFMNNTMDPGTLRDSEYHEVRTIMGWGVDPSSFVGPAADLEVLHERGPLDMTTLGEFLRSGVSLDLVLGDGNCRVKDMSAVEMISREKELVQDGRHCLDPGALGEDLLSRTAALMDVLHASGSEPDVALEGPSISEVPGNNVWIWDGGLALSVMEDPHSGIPCWVVILTGDEGGRNDIIWPFETGRSPLPYGFLPAGAADDAMFMDPDGTDGDVILDRIYFDTYLRDDPDEAVRIMNLGDDPLDISGYYLTDDEGMGLSSDGVARLPEGTVILPGDCLWLARDHGAFRFQFGVPPDLSLFNSTSGPIMRVCSGDLRLANSNDSVALRDRYGRVIDVVPYGGTEWKNLWPHCIGGSWSGEAVPAPGWGRILHRKLTWNGIGVPEVNGAGDWVSVRPLYPGQSEIGPFGTRAITSMKVGVCPESGSELLDEMISGARNSIHVNVYELTSRWIAASLVGSAQRGVEVKVILEGGPVGGTTSFSELAADMLTEGGVEVRWMSNDIPEDIRDRYRYDHAKYIVADGERALISSDNFKDTSFPRKGCGTGSTRGWVIAVESQGIASDLERVFGSDWAGADMIPNNPDRDMEDAETDWFGSVYGECGGMENTSPFEVEKASTGQILISPDHLSLPGNPLIESIRNARSSINMELLDLSMNFDLGGVKPTEGALKEWDVDAGTSPVTNPYINELVRAAARGVKVRILLDGSDFNGDGERDSDPLAEWLNTIAGELAIEDSLKVRSLPVPFMDGEREIALLHNKGALFDGRQVWLSSFNWGPTSCLENREVGILIDSPETAGYLKGMFEHDWGATILDDLDLEVRRASLTRIDRNNMECGISLDVRWEGHEDLMIFVVADEGSSSCRESESIPPGFDGTVHFDFGMGVREGEGRVSIGFISGDRSYEGIVIPLTESESYGEGYAHNIFTQPFIPLLLISSAAILISLGRSFIARKKGREPSGSVFPAEE